MTDSATSENRRYFGPRLGFTFTAATAAGALALGWAGSVQAALIPNAIPGVTGLAFHQGDSADPNGDGGVNNITNGDGLTIGAPLDSTTWLHDSAWQTGWQGAGTFTVDSAGTGSALTSGAWFVLDLGAAFTNLDDLHIWNVREVLNRGTKNIDLFYAVSPTVAPVTGSAYNFTSGGWTSWLTNHDIPMATAGGTDSDDVIDLNGIASARYLGIRMNSNYNSNFRVGFAETQVTVVPEPVGVSLLALGGIGLLARRRRG
jgi:hypothetical protein